MRGTTFIFASTLALASLPLSHGVMASEFRLLTTWEGEALLDQFGISVTAVGDFNGDGRDDFVAGANVNDHTTTSAGRAYLFAGGSDTPSSWQSTFDGSDFRGYFGQAVDGGGDFDGDGETDMAVGSPGPGEDGSRAGAAHVYLGGPTYDASEDLRLDGSTNGGQFGFSVLLEGDLNGDGRDDLVVGEPRAGTGQVLIVFGHDPKVMTPPPTLSIEAPSNLDARFGFSLALLEDRDGDGCDELVVSAPRSARAGAWSGAVFVFGGGSSMDATPDLVLTGSQAGEEFGRSLCTSADLDGDGWRDLLVGSPFFNAGASADAGRVRVFRGGAALDSIPDAEVWGEETGERFGTSIAAGFDWNGDGSLDWAVGAPDHSSLAALGGALYVFTGLPTVPGTPLHREIGATADAHLGTALDAIRRFTPSMTRGGLLVGGYNGTNSGRVVLFAFEEPGTAAPTPSVDAQLSAPEPNPFNPRTVLRLTTTAPDRWQVQLYDARGRQRRTVLERWLPAGDHLLTVEATDLPSGVYWFEARSGSGDRLVQRATLVR